MKLPNILQWKAIHKWLGLIMTIVILLFCVSGIILNHREAVSGFNVDRSILPSGYRIVKYNNGSVKGTIRLKGDSILAYGNVGIWLTDSKFSSFSDYNAGLPTGMDGRGIKNIVCTPEGELWCAANFDIYHYENGCWAKVAIPANNDRISDIALDRDSFNVVVLTRSKIYTLPLDRLGGGESDPEFSEHILGSPNGYVPKTTLFKTLWLLHSGELFGASGRIIVDLLAIVIIFLCVTGLAIFMMPSVIRSSLKKGIEACSKKRFMKWSVMWHNRAGYYTILFTLMIALTGMCLRPPLMIPFVMVETAPVPGSNLDNDNPWHDKLRAIRWDTNSGKWLMSTSDGFYSIDSDFKEAPEVVGGAAPPVSPMGITVFEEEDPGIWIIGSFSGLYRWDMADTGVTDYFTGSSYNGREKGRPVSTALVSGFSKDLDTPSPVVFDYNKGADGLTESSLIGRQPMALWNAALELHVGRCYAPFLGPFSELFVFLSGLILMLVLVSGLIVLQRQKHKTINNNSNKVKQ